jgi:hypothetical protein
LIYTAATVPSQGGPLVAVKVVHVSDLSGKQADEGEFGKLIVHDHPKYTGPITLEVLPDEIGDLPEDEAYVRIEYIEPGSRSGRRATLSIESFNRLASSGDMNTILMEAMAERQDRGQRETPRRTRPAGRTTRGKVNYATLEHAGEPHRGRITEAEKELVRNNLDKINKRLREAGLREIDPSDSTMQERYGLSPT